MLTPGYGRADNRYHRGRIVADGLDTMMRGPVIHDYHPDEPASDCCCCLAAVCLCLFPVVAFVVLIAKAAALGV